jgi:dTDP-4-amino-4,6-dideoxygalactose transaminase
MKFIQKKSINYIYLSSILSESDKDNHFSNYGPAVQLLEQTARDMLKISEDKAIIATSSGAAALQAILYGLGFSHHKPTIATQAFTFPCNFQGLAENPEIFDCTTDYDIDISTVQSEYIIITNCFGHLTNINRILETAQKNNKTIIFDNAATPYSFYKGENACNYGLASFISLHHTKPIGFGEGGLAIIDKKYESAVRSAINFGKYNNQFTPRGSNFKMSDVSAAGILQWWKQFNIDSYKDTLMNNYYQQLSKYNSNTVQLFKNHSIDFMPSCLPIIENSPVLEYGYCIEEYKKYYVPIKPLPNASRLYTNIACLPITSRII